MDKYANEIAAITFDCKNSDNTGGDATQNTIYIIKTTIKMTNVIKNGINFAYRNGFVSVSLNGYIFLQKESFGIIVR